MTAALLECTGLTVRFGGLTALDRLDLRLEDGQLLALIGPNGSGKTTCFNALTGLVPATGSRRVAGVDLSRGGPQAVYRAGVARTFQRSRLLPGLSAFDNLMLGRHRQLDHGLRSTLLRRSRLHAQFREEVDRAGQLVERFSPALRRRLFEPVEVLSMIDRRRLEICRALLGAPRVLLLDEPAAGMTEDETRALLADILRTRQSLPGLGIILIEHEMGLIERVSDRCVVLNFGQKICEGNYATIAADAQVQAAYLGAE